MQSAPKITYEVENALSSLSGVTLSEIKTAQELGEKVGYTNDQFFQFAKQADLSGDTLKQYQEYLKNTGSTASKLGSTLKSVAANIGIMLAVTVAVKAAVAIFDELNVTFEEQQEVVDALSTKITTLKDEYSSLSEKKDRTDQENNQLKYLERQLEVQEELYKVEYNRLALKDLEGKGDILSNGNLKDLNPQSSAHGNEVYASNTNTAGLKYNINTELKKLDEARKKIAEAPNANTVKYWDNLQDKSVEKLKAQREQLLEEWKASSDSYNLIKKYMDTGAFDDDPTNKAKYQNLLKAYETDMNQLQAMTDDIEVSLGIKIDPSMDDAKDKIDDIKKEAEKPITIQMTISNIEALSTGLDKINAIREDIKDKGDFDFGSLVDEDFVAQFGGLGESYQKFIDTVANSPTDLKACQSAFDDLTTSYLYQNDALKNITKETYNATVTMLKQRGVANASAVASSALAKSKIDAFLAGKDLTQITEDEIKAFLHENGVIDVTIGMIDALQLAKLTANGTQLDFGGDLDNITSFVEKLGGTTVALKMLGDAKKYVNSGTWSGMSDVANAAKQEIQSAINSAMDIKVDYKGYTPKKSSSSSASKTEKYKAEIDAYAKLKAELDKIQSDISANEKKYDNTDSEREKIALLQQRITLTQKEQSALHNLNNARDKEIGNNVELLKQKGFLVSYNPDSNELEISNLEHLNELKGKDQEATNDLIKEYEDLINTTQSLNEENRDSSNSWWDSYYSLSEYKDEIKDLNQQIFDNEVDNQEHLLKLLEQRSGTEKEQILLLKEMQENALRQRQKLEDEDYVANIKKIRDLENAWTSYYDKILEAQKKQLENQKEILELEKSNMDSAISAATSVLDDEISSLQEELDALSDANDERERKLKLQELEANLEKAKSQKTAYIYRDGTGFGYEVDQSAVDEAQNAIDDYKSEQKLKAKQDALQAEIDSLQKYKEKWEEISNAVTEQENKQNAAMLLGSNWKNKLINQDSGVLNDFKNDYVDVEESINEKTKDIETITTELANHLDTEFTRIIKSFEDMTKAISGAFGISVTEVADEESTPKSASETKQKSSTSFWDKIVGKVTSVFDLLTNGTSTNTDSLDENNSNLKTSSTTQKTNTDTVKDNTTNVKSNSSYVDTNSNKVSDNSSSVDTNSGNLETLNDTLITSTSKIVGAAETVATAKKSKDDDDDSGSSSSSSSSSGSSSKSSGGSIISKVVGGISKVISSLTKHHSGGIIGDTDDKGKALFELAKQPLKADEEVSILQYGELVLTEEQQANIVARLNEMSSYDNMLSSALSSAFGNSGYLPNNFNIPASMSFDYPVVGNKEKEKVVYQNIKVENNYETIEDVEMLKEAIMELESYAVQKSTSKL